MTLVVGMNLGDSVGVFADSRATLHHRDGRTESVDNALKVYVFPPYLLVGIAGDALSASVFVNSFYLRCLVTSTPRKAFERVVDIEWMRSNLLDTYESEIRHQLLDKSNPFRCVFAVENTPALIEQGESPHEISVPLTVSSASFGDSAKILTVADKYSNLRRVFSINLPGGQIEEAPPGNALTVGSGSMSDVYLSQTPTAIAHMYTMSHGDRLAAAAADMAQAAVLSGDESFNGIYFGMSLSCGEYETILQGFNSWPDDSIPKDHYTWEAYNFNDVPAMIPYSAGLDVAELNTGWIYDAGTKKRMKLQSYLEPEFIDAQVKGQSLSARWKI